MVEKPGRGLFTYLCVFEKIENETKRKRVGSLMIFLSKWKNEMKL